MATKTRYDKFDIKAVKTDEGFLIDTPVITRTGIFLYRNDDGSIRRELRMPQDVFNEDSLNSYKGKPITVVHPGEEVNSKNIDKVSVGTILSPGKRNDDDTLSADIIIHKPERMGSLRALSVGYKTDLEETPGYWLGGDDISSDASSGGEYFDAIQRKIRSNHLSVVKSARAGNIARLNLDCEEVEEDEQLNEGNTKMIKVRLDNGLEYEASPEVVQALEKAKADLKLKTDAADAVQAKADGLQAKVDGFPAALEKARNDAIAEVSALSALQSKATSFKIDCKDMAAKDIKVAVIKLDTPTLNLDGQSDAYIDGAYAAAVIRLDAAAVAGQRQQGKDAAKVKNDAAAVSSDAAYQNHMQHLATK